MQDVNNFQREVLDRLRTIEVKIDNYDKIKEQVYQNQRDILSLKSQSDSQDEHIKQELQNQKKEIESIKDTNKWLSRTIGGILIGTAIAVVIGCIKLGIGI